MKRTVNTHTGDTTAPAQSPRRTGADRFGLLGWMLLLAASLLLFFRLASSGLLDRRYLFLVGVFLLVINALHAVVQLPIWRNKAGKLLCGVLALILSAGLIWLTVHMETALNRIGKIFDQQLFEKRQILVVVRADDPAQELADTAGYSYGYVDGWSEADTTETLQALRQQLGAFPEHLSDTPAALADALLSEQVDAVLLSASALGQLEELEEYADLDEKIRVIYTHTISRQVNALPGNTQISEPFIVYCNGIDSRRNDIHATGNSDVNILMVVNPKTRQVLLLNTPRDYYVPLHMNGQNDKLTHAGVYGIEESILTLNDLYGIQTPYYIRLNFFGLADIVDAIGGVDVVSPKAFTTKRLQLPGADGKLERKSFSFPAGPVHLNGQEALAFSRERYAFATGDNQRGLNQMTVIQGIIEKITTPAVLGNFQQTLTALSNAFVSNIPFDQVKSLIRAQQQDTRGWHITSYAVTGAPGSDYCYSWPGQPLYVTRPDPQSVELAKTLIQQVLSGQAPVVPE